MNIRIKIAKKTMNLNIKKTIDILKIYGVNKKDIEDIVNKKMNLKYWAIFNINFIWKVINLKIKLINKGF